MNRMTIGALALLAMSFGTVDLDAQGRHGPDHRGPFGPAGIVLQNADRLGLTEAQRAAFEELREELAEEARSLRDEARDHRQELREERRELREERAEARQEMRSRMQSLRERHQTAFEEALAALDETQRAKVRALIDEWRQERGDRRERRHRRPDRTPPGE